MTEPPTEAMIAGIPKRAAQEGAKQVETNRMPELFDRHIDHRVVRWGRSARIVECIALHQQCPPTATVSRARIRGMRWPRPRSCPLPVGHVEQDRTSPCGLSACSGHPASCPPSAYASQAEVPLRTPGPPCSEAPRSVPSTARTGPYPSVLWDQSCVLYGIESGLFQSVIVNVFRAETLLLFSTDRREGARCKAAVGAYPQGRWA
jgi:hypothetical protein